MTNPKFLKSVSSKSSKKSIRSSSDIFDQFYSKKVATVPKTGPQRPNIFKSLRPSPHKAKDYNIEQEYTTLQKGPLKLRCAITEAKYEWYSPDEVPKVFEKIIKRKQHGRGPLEDLLEETWNKVVTIQQRRIAAENKRRYKESRMKFKTEMKFKEQLILKILGPDWYQELSPKQVKIVDNLHDCMTYDIKNNTVTKTVANLQALGLILDPNSPKIRFALSKCCSCPVEFLLKFYNILNPNRTAYSVEDRLLLSAVVRLTITDTLKELHVRIPSPPRKETISKSKLKPVKSEKIVSPYLKPFDFKPMCWNTKNYFKRDREYPRSEYFSYRKELIDRLIKLCTETDLVLSIEENNIEMKDVEDKSKKKKRNDCNLAVVPSKRSLVSQSSDFLTGIAAVEHDLVKEWAAAQKVYNELFDSKCVPALHKPSVFIPCHIVKETASKKTISSTSKRNPSLKVVNPTVETVEDTVYLNKTIEFKEKIDGLPEMNNDDSPIVIGNTSEKNKINDYESNYFTKIVDAEEKVEPIIECFCSKKNLEPYEITITDSLPDYNEIQKLQNEINRLNSKNKESVCTNPLHKKGCKKCEAAIKKQQADKEAENLIEESKKVGTCSCKDRVLEKIKVSLCPCDRCEADRIEANTRRIKIIADLKEQEDGSMVKIISGIKTEKKCTCMEKYATRWKNYEDRVEVKKAQDALCELKHKYVISGVTIDSEGKPVYILSSVQPKPECECISKLKEQEEENERIARMPPMPDSCNKYLISGVHATPEGNVYIINGLQKNCNCMDLYETFTKKHSVCLKLFEEYMKKIQYDTEEYMEDIAENYTEFIPDVNKLEEEEVPVNIDNFEEEEENYDKLAQECALENIFYGEDIDCCNDEEYIDEEQGVAEEESELSCCEVDEIPEPCSLGPIPSCKLAPSSEISTESVSEETELKRYIILEEIPCNVEEQQEILKKALNYLADDGFPLAKLPDVHRLPHFKLWLQMRCKKFWTQEEKAKYIPKSRRFWRHIDVARENVRLPKKVFLKDEPEKHNWKFANFIKRIDTSIANDYYGKLKIARINYGRKLFPTLYDNEFPTKAFRDVFFAYMPSKVNDVLPVRVWLGHEYRNQELLRRKRCR